MIRRASADKPHRCPRCWRVPDSLHSRTSTGRARWNSTYRCSHGHPEVRWWKGWNDDMVSTWIVAPARRLRRLTLQDVAVVGFVLTAAVIGCWMIYHLALAATKF